MAAYNFGISKTTLIHHLLKFQEKENPTNFEYTARNDVTKIFSATKKEFFKLAFQYGKENGVVMPEREVGKEPLCW